MTAKEIIDKYISFFEKRGHKRIPNSPLVPLNDPTTLFTNSGMQPLIPYLAGEPHPEGKRFVNVQNVFRGQGALDDIDEVGDNRHLTFFRMIGNWSLGDYFKKEQLNWIFEYIITELGIDPEKLYVSVFGGHKSFPKDEEAISIWTEIFKKAGIDPKNKIYPYDATKNWWSRAGVPENMPDGELGGPDSEIFYDFGVELKLHENSQFKNIACHINCDCGRYLEISNNVFMQFKKEEGNFIKLPQQNVDHGAGVERLLMAAENQPDVFLTSLFAPVIKSLEKQTGLIYKNQTREMRMITAHLSSSCFIINAGINPSNTEQGYILRRLIRRSIDSFTKLKGKNLEPIIESIVDQYKSTDPDLVDNFENIKNTLLEEANKYQSSMNNAKSFLIKKYPSATKQTGDELMGTTEISPDDAFIIYTTHGLSPTQIKSLGYTFDQQAFAEKMKGHKDLSKSGAGQKFKGGLADHQERTIMGHTATHLMHQALRDMFGKELHQTGSNITTERVRFDFNFDRKLNEDEIAELENTVNKKIKDDLPVHFEMIPTETAKKMGAIGLFTETYQDTSKIYFIGGDSKNPEKSYSIEFCGGPHVEFTSKLKSFKIIKQENIGNKQRRIYASVG
ncbi:MAG TPA: alanine--tRNA ligase [Candidatus Saccharimonadales bacterium]|nr:alanine--tRNA ligase [Candidatus Saccharimonadales bacterium]